MTDSTALTVPAQPSLGQVLLSHGAALVLVAAATLTAVWAEGWVAAPNLSLVFVLPVVITAVFGGWGPSITATLLGVGCFNFFLIEPRFTLRVAAPENLWVMGLLLAVAAIVSAVAGESRRRAVDAREHAEQASALQGLARALVGAIDRPGIAGAAADALGRLFRAPAVVLIADGDALSIEAATPDAQLSPADLEAARWALASRLATRSDVYPVDQARFDFWPLITPSRLQALVGVQIFGRRGGRPAAAERLAEIVSGYLTVALERERYAAQVAEARLVVESERVKADLLAAVSHDLRTPLSTILFTLQSLQKFGEAHDAQTRADLLALAEAETARLSGLVGNLLDMSRIDEAAMAVRPSVAAPADLIASALRRAETALAGRTIDSQVATDAAALFIDYPLAETALANVLENAGKYAPAGSTVQVRWRQMDGMGAIEVLDQGPGFPEPSEPLFAKFARGVEGDGRPPGTGLGLAIARGFLKAQGGDIEALNRAGGGGRVIVRLPLAPEGSAP